MTAAGGSMHTNPNPTGPRSGGPWLALLMLAACGGGGGGASAPPPAPAPQVLVRVDALAAGADCASGGVQVRTGPDSNGNGTLDAAETSATYSACNGAVGAAGGTARARVLPELPGAPCALGGLRIETGLDTNASGALDDAEVARRTTACAGSTAPRLLAVASEPPGAACAAGGSRVSGGIDVNLSGALDAAEVDTTQFVCNAVAGATGTGGAAAARSLVALAVEPPGATCAAGGTRLLAGLDSNADGLLDGAEVGASSVVCDGGIGTPGAAGAAGINALLRLSAEVAGPACATGGTRVDGGADTNANGQLDVAEVTSTRYLCNGIAGSGGGAAMASLVTVTAEAPGSACLAGGRRLDTGLDSNGNGVLDAAELRSSGFVCVGTTGAAGSAGASSLVALADAGSACAQGGRQVSSGLDSNANGVLDPAEVASVERVCNGSVGSTGVAGAAGRNALIALHSEAPGAHCALGGTRVDSGVDSDGNDTLATGEVTATHYLCRATDGTGFGWTAVAGGSVQAAGNAGYLALDGAAAVVLTLPAAPLPGDTVKLTGVGAGGWQVAQNAGQRIVLPAAAGGIRRSSVLAQAVAVGPALPWRALAASADLSLVLGVAANAALQVSTDGGATWTAKDSSRNWAGAAVSADGRRMAAVVAGGQIHTSADFGQSWTVRETARNWRAIAASADGLRLVAAAQGGQLHTSSDGGVTWTARESVRSWWAVASSADGKRLVAVVNGGQIHVSSDAGVSWVARESARTWVAVASSADGQRFAAADYGGRLYQSSDGGASWVARAGDVGWSALAVAADGTRLVAGDEDGQLWLSSDGGASWAAQAVTLPRIVRGLVLSADGADVLLSDDTTAVRRSSAIRAVRETTGGTTGGLRGGPGSALELQYIGHGEYLLRSWMGPLFVD